MRQFDVVINDNRDTNRYVPYLLILQAELFDGLATRVVAPLFPHSEYGQSLDRLNPVINIKSAPYVLSIAELAGVPVNALGKRLASAAEHRLEIISALDFLITGN